MTASIKASQQRQIESARQRLTSQQERDRNNSETTKAKWLQQQTGCTWSEAIGAVIRSAA